MCGGHKVGDCIDLDDRPTGELFCVRCGAVWKGRGTKRCSRCGEVKPLEEFPLDRTSSDGRFSHCLACKRETSRMDRRAKGVPARKTYPQLRDQEWLEQKHLRERKTPKEIAAELGCEADLVRAYLRQAGVRTIPERALVVLRGARQGGEA